MLVLSRSVGESVIVGGDKIITVKEIGPEFVDICLYGIADQTKVVSMILRKHETVEILPHVHVTLIDLLTAKARVRLGFVLPREIPLHRKEGWDAIQGV